MTRIRFQEEQAAADVLAAALAAYVAFEKRKQDLKF